MIKELIESNCIKIGTFNLKNGDISKYYFDMKNIISYPKLLSAIGDKIYEKSNDFDIICGIPYGGLPIATYISTKYNKLRWKKTPSGSRRRKRREKIFAKRNLNPSRFSKHFYKLDRRTNFKLSLTVN